MRFLAFGLLAACGASAPVAAPASSTAPLRGVVDTELALATEWEPVPETEREAAIRHARVAGMVGGDRPARDEQAIRSKVRARSPQLGECYERELQRRPTLSGTTQVEFFIDARGSVSSARGSGFDPEIDACVADVVRGLLFLESPEVTRVIYPVAFRPETEHARP